tara:strand:+ start:2228 stop:3061 length:834 start_codon:yes stop_codon:yes gene_type:complete
VLSLITTGRDDGYGHRFLDRFHMSVASNLDALDKCGIDYEYIICEWNPPRDYLINNDMFRDLFKKYNLREVIVSKSVVEQESLNPNVFYEYFAKNCGARRAKHDNIIIVNSDIVIPEESFKGISRVLQNGLDDNKFYRLQHRLQIELDDPSVIVDKHDIYNVGILAKNADAHIAGFCSGDFLFVTKDTFETKGQGYDETNPTHRTTSQTAMDGEILWNMAKAGVTISLIDLPYYHINHGYSHQRSGDYNTSGYDNKNNWGFIDYKTTKVSNKLEIIG